MPAAQIASAEPSESCSRPLRLLSMRKKPANPYSPCVEGNAHKIIDFPKMVDAEVFRGFTSGKNRCDMCKIFTFSNRDDLEEFLRSPVHEKYKKFNAEIRESNYVIDYEVDE